MPKAPEGVLPPDVVEEIESLEVPESLLARTEPTPEEQPQSLLEPE